MKRLEFCCDLFVNGSGFQVKNSCYETQEVEDDYQLSAKDIDYESIENEPACEDDDDNYYHTRLVDEDGIEIDDVGVFQKEYIAKKKARDLLKDLHERCFDAGDCRTSYEFMFENDCLKFKFAFIDSDSFEVKWKIDFENTIDSLKEIEKDIRYFTGYKRYCVVEEFERAYNNYGEITGSFEEAIEVSQEVLENSLCNLADKVEEVISELELDTEL